MWQRTPQAARGTSWTSSPCNVLMSLRSPLPPPPPAAPLLLAAVATLGLTDAFALTELSEVVIAAVGWGWRGAAP